MTDPVCPRCGCRARRVVMTAEVECEVLPGGALGKIIRVRKRLPDAVPRYICGGHHVFTDPSESLSEENHEDTH